MNVGKRLVSLFGVTLFILITSASIQAQTFTISGRVSDPPSGTGVGIEGVTLTLTLDSNTKRTAHTGSEGNYSFPDIAAGSNYTLVASKPGFLFQPQDYVVTNVLANETRHFTLSGTTTTTIQFEQEKYDVVEDAGTLTVKITRSGETTGTATVDYTTDDDAGASDCNVIADRASSRCDYAITVGTLQFGPNELEKTISIPIINDSYKEDDEDFRIVLGNPAGATFAAPSIALVTIKDNEVGVHGPNPVDEAEFFVRQHYIDFLNREPDAGGLAFWTNEITSCGADAACVEVKRINVSAAFYISIEFQETGYLVYRIYKAAFGNLGDGNAPVPINLTQFLPETQAIGRGVVVGQGDWEQQLNDNKNAFVAEFVTRPQFTTAHPTTTTPEEFVIDLFDNAGVTPSAADRQAAIEEFAGATTSADLAARGRALRRVAENSILEQQEFNRAFVLMQYFGYLRRSPNSAPDNDYSGYNFWLGKLNQFNGNFVDAEMVKAFIVAGEFRERFGP